MKRVLRKQGLFRRKNKTEDLEVALFLEQQLMGSGQLHGYRWMHQKCIQNTQKRRSASVLALQLCELINNPAVHHVSTLEGAEDKQKLSVKKKKIVG